MKPKMDIQLKPRPWYKKYLSHILTGTATLAFAIYVIILSLRPQLKQIEAHEYPIAHAVEAPFMEYLDVEGHICPIQTVKLNAQESGTVEHIAAEEGTMLHKGDTILLLANPELLRTIDEEQAEWENQQLNYREQEIEMEQHTLTLRQQALDAAHQIASLEKTLQQSREECQMGIKSKAELEVLEENYHHQRKKAELQQQSLHHDSVCTHLRREIVQANRQASMRRHTRTAHRIDNLAVRATVDGQLSFLNVTLGQQIASGTSIGEIKVLTEYKVRATLSEYYIDRITTGLPASIQHQDHKYPLRISKVVPEVKDRTFACELVFTASQPTNIRLGKSYRIQIELDRPETALIIPRGDFYPHTAGRWIYRLSPDGHTARKTPIEIGRQNPQQYEILSGLKPGDKVLVSGYDKLGDTEELVIE